MSSRIESPWRDCKKLLPFRDHKGRWRWPLYCQKRTVVIDERQVTQYREREETEEELLWRIQW